MSTLEASRRCGQRVWSGIRRPILLVLLALAMLGGCARPPLDGKDPTTAPTDTAVVATLTATATAPSTQLSVATPEASPSSVSAPGLIGLVNLGGPAFYGRGPLALSVIGGTAYTANEGSRNLSIVAEGRVLGALALEAGPYDVAGDPATGRIFVAAESARSISVVEQEAVIAVWPLDVAPTAITLVSDELWAGAADGSMVRLDASSGQVISSEAPLPEGMIVDLIALESGGVLAATTSGIHLLDPVALRPGASHAIPGLRAIAAAGNNVYACAYDPGTESTVVHVLDAALQPQRTLIVPEDAVALAAGTEPDSLFVSGNVSNKISRLDPEDGTVLAQAIAGLSPQRLAYDAVADRLYATGYQSDTLSVFDGAGLALVQTVPLTLRITALAPAQASESLYVGLNTGEVRLLAPDGEHAFIQDAGYPVALAELPDGSGLAVLDQSAARATLYDAAAEPYRSAQTNSGPQGLYVDLATSSVFAGDAVLSLESDATGTLDLNAGGSSVPPVQVLRDTRRDQIYVVALNGQPGSGGGYVVYRQAGSDWVDTPTPGRLSVIDIVYDPTVDRFFATSGQMGTYSLQAYDAGSTTLLVDVPLAGPPQALLLSDRFHHLWVAVDVPASETSGAHTLLTAYDTRVLVPVATVRINDAIGTATVDAQSGRLYLGAAGGALIYLVRDALMPAPAPAVRVATPPVGATSSPTVATLPTASLPVSAPTVTPAATRTQTPRPTVAPTLTATTMPECEIPVADVLKSAWASSAGRLGCPTHPAMRENWGYQPFERGTAYWRRDTHQVLIALNSGTLLPFEDRWLEGMPDQACQAEPPPGLWQPIRGFGLVWCQQTPVREGLGWALQPEAAVLSTYQLFSQGILFSVGAEGVTWAANHGTWTQLEP